MAAAAVLSACWLWPAPARGVERADAVAEFRPVGATVVASDFSSTVVEIPLGAPYEKVRQAVGAGLVAIPPAAGVAPRVRSLTVRQGLPHGGWGEPRQEVTDRWPDLVQVSEPGIWRDLRVVSVTVRPRPSADVLVERLTLELVYEGTGANLLTHWGRPVSPEFDRLYRAAVLNYAWLDVEPWSRSDAIRYLIIVPDQLVLGAGPLTWWRTLTGMRAHAVSRSEIGGGSPANRDQIKAYIQDAYDNWPQPPEFVLLLGDLGAPSAPDEEMPTYYHSGCPSDHWYALLDGGDYYADVFVGRIPTQLIQRCWYVVEKIYKYERTPLIDPGVTWQEKALMCAADGGYPSITDAKRWFAGNLFAYGYESVDSVYVPQMPGIDPDAMIATAVNQGRGIVNYRGNPTFSSGWTPLDFTSTDVQNYVHNGWRLPLVLSVSCGSGDYEGTTCFGEYWLKIPENDGSTKGCIAFFGATSLSTHTLQNNWLDKGISVGLSYEGMGKVAEATEYGKMWMLAQLGHSSYAQATFYWYGVLGDPGTQLWMDRPQALQVTHPASIATGAQSVTVWVQDQQGAPLTGALACVWKGNEVYQYGYTMVGGGLNLAVDPVTAGSMLLTVTARNMLPYEGVIQVTAGDVTPPEAINDLAIELSAEGDVTLTWTEVTHDTTGASETMDHYDVYRNTVAYLNPDGGLTPLATVPAGTTSYTDAASGVGQPTVNHFYCVIAVDQAGNRSAVSNRVGEFDYDSGP